MASARSPPPPVVTVAPPNDIAHHVTRDGIANVFYALKGRDLNPLPPVSAISPSSPPHPVVPSQLAAIAESQVRSSVSMPLPPPPPPGEGSATGSLC
jgi:hypothetical protein